MAVGPSRSRPCRYARGGHSAFALAMSKRRPVSHGNHRQPVSVTRRVAASCYPLDKRTSQPMYEPGPQRPTVSKAKTSHRMTYRREKGNDGYPIQCTWLNMYKLVRQARPDQVRYSGYRTDTVRAHTAPHPLKPRPAPAKLPTPGGWLRTAAARRQSGHVDSCKT